MQKRTQQEEQTRQLKIISAQMAPMGVFVRIGFYLFAVLLALGLLSILCTGIKFK
jgi:hypothetical protein